MLKGGIGASGEPSKKMTVSPELVEAAISKKQQMPRKVRAPTEFDPMLVHGGARFRGQI